MVRTVTGQRGTYYCCFARGHVPHCLLNTYVCPQRPALLLPLASTASLCSRRPLLQTPNGLVLRQGPTCQPFSYPSPRIRERWEEEACCLLDGIWTAVKTSLQPWLPRKDQARKTSQQRNRWLTGRWVTKTEKRKVAKRRC